MKSYLTSQKGTALIGVMIAIVIIAALVYGSSFFYKNTNENDSNLTPHSAEAPRGKNVNSPLDAINALNQAKDDIADIQDAIDERTGANMESDFDEHTIKVTNIEAGQNLVSPAVIEGEGVAFENTLIVELRNQDHETMVKEVVTVKAPDVGKRGPFKITLHFNFSSTKEGFVAVYEESAKDGSEVNLVEIPVRFNDENIDDWQTYQNEENGFEFQYPDSATVESQNYGVMDPEKASSIIIKNKNKEIYISIVIKNDYFTDKYKELNQSLDKYVDYVWKLNNPNDGRGLKEEIQKTSLGGKNGFKFIAENELLTESGGHLIPNEREILFYEIENKYKVIIEVNINSDTEKILDTFKFTN